MVKKIFKIFAGPKTGMGSRDAQGFSSNGSFYNYLSQSQTGAIGQFRKEHKGMRIYNILGARK